jgi:hypothetical protein
MMHNSLPTALLALILAVAACAGPSTAATSAPTATPSEAATLTQPAATPTEAASPTTAPTLTPAATATETATLEPTADPLHTACDHPYWPLRVGAQWVSKSGESVITETITAVTGDLDQAEAAYEIRYSSGVIQTGQFFCDKDGIAYGDSSSVRPDGHIATKKIISRAGQSLIAPDKLVDGAEWEWTQTADYSVPVYENGAFVRQSEYQNTAGQSCTATGPQAITVTLGEFEAIHLSCTGESVSTVDGQSTTFPFNSEQNYVLGIGSVSDSLLSYEIP